MCIYTHDHPIHSTDPSVYFSVCALCVRDHRRVIILTYTFLYGSQCEDTHCPNNDNHTHTHTYTHNPFRGNTCRGCLYYQQIKNNV